MPLFSSFSNTGKAKATFPDQAGTPSIVSQASGQVAISWTAPSFSGGAPITDYKIEYSSDSGSSWTTWSHAANSTASATITGLTDYLTYMFRVTAINAVGQGTTSANSPGASQFNAASGGTETTVSNYNGTGQTWKVHTFNGNSTFTATRSVTQYKVLVVGGGGGGGPSGGSSPAGGGGNGGYINDAFQTVPIGNHSVTVGSGGSGVAYGWETGGTGGTSSLGSIVSANGGTGGTKNGANGTTNGGSSNTSGTAISYGSGGTAGAQCNKNCNGSAGSSYYTPTANRGGGGGGERAEGSCCGGSAGASGVVVVAYRIA